MLAWWLVACGMPGDAPAGRTRCTHGPPSDGGRVAEFAPLAEAFPLGDRVVSRTTRGTVVLHGVDLRVDRVLENGVAVIGQGGREVLIARADGRVASVGLSGDVVEFGVVSGTPAWLGESAGRRTAVGVAATDNGLRIDVLDLESGAHTIALGEVVYGLDLMAHTSAATEDRGTLYLGWNWGEWGGGIARVRLANAEARWPLFGEPIATVRMPDGTKREVTGDSVRGFARVGDEVWAYGGTTHLGLWRSWVATTGDTSTRLYVGGNTGWMDGADPDPASGPDQPITHIIPRPDGSLVVLAYSEVWRSDPTLSTWTKAGDLDLSYSNVPPYDTGTDPAVTSAWIDHEGRLTISTRLNGLCRWTPSPAR